MNMNSRLMEEEGGGYWCYLRSDAGRGSLLFIFETIRCLFILYVLFLLPIPHDSFEMYLSCTGLRIILPSLGA
ncbi:hypothetical protein BDP81DRAFT_415835 [Colletotrichum phormii]|uniref:Uncharacterized protein n=1 Tax=Colletotrichum phormii TaxID=359342 RepID=A0AAJ0A4K2_9PEZI|nr:uncharacterized protein BDP81DRAFT_415835 [Colletotrichum phormii]KAK1654490.1 hypothetical protein BDP81DRAFT_415835 [Colletotrichum phormii]